MKKFFRSTLFDGLLLIVLGVVMLVRPDVALQSLCLLAGILLCVMGAIKAVVFFVNKNGDKTPALLILGIVQLLLGIALIVKPGLFLQIFQFVVAVLLVYGACLMFVQAMLLRHLKGFFFFTSLICGLVMVILAAIIFANPAAFAAIMTQLEGISLIIEGLSTLLLLRKAK